MVIQKLSGTANSNNDGKQMGNQKGNVESGKIFNSVIGF